MGKKILTPAAAMKILELRAEKDEWGEPKWTGDAIAQALGVSPGTVWRVIKKQAAYAQFQAFPRTAEMNAITTSAKETMAAAAEQETNPEVKASLERLTENLAAAEPTPLEERIKHLSEAAKETARRLLGPKPEKQ